MFKKSLIALTLLTAIAGCNTINYDVTGGTPKAQMAAHNGGEQVTKIVDQYFDQSMKMYPTSGTFNGRNELNDQFRAPISEESLAFELAFEKKYLKLINQVDTSKLTGQALLSHELFKLDRQMAIQSSQFPSHMLPINQMSGLHNSYAGLGSGKSAQPFKTISNYDDFISRSDGFVAWMDSAISAMRSGISNNVTLPKVLAKKLLPQLKAQIHDDVTDSIFWMPITNMPDNIQGTDKARLTSDYRHMVSNKLIPAYQRMATFIENDYIPNARETIGYTQLPNGKGWYQFAIKTHTTMDLSAEQIHAIGLEEVARILSEMKMVKEQVNFDGDMTAFFDHLQNDDQFYFSTAQQVIDGYNQIKDSIEQRVPLLFDIKPKAPYVVRAVEKYRAASAAGASYQGPAPDGSRPGIFYINTHNLKAQPKFIMETLSIHEAAPGHHFQVALQQEIEGLPDYRKFGDYTAYSEGWALYAESLGKEMGLFSDPYMWYGRLVDEQLRAMRLVVDTGMHALGWSREKAIEYMKANSSMAESDIVAEVERYIAWPGQALSYKLGQRKIRKLRDYAENALGDKFDVRKFHTQILIDGALPMPTLENKIKRWVNEVKATL
jgi:uncharacterized protein (DUF885 family)